MNKLNDFANSYIFFFKVIQIGEFIREGDLTQF